MMPNSTGSKSFRISLFAFSLFLNLALGVVVISNSRERDAMSQAITNLKLDCRIDEGKALGKTENTKSRN
jgi:hypothetical protein